MNFFEQELRKLFENSGVIDNPSFSGRVCTGMLDDNLRVRVQFVTSGHADHYDTLKVNVLNRTEGPVDTLSLKLRDLLGKKAVPNNPNFSGGVAPYIWVYKEEVDWYSYHPTEMDYQAMRQAVDTYLEGFRPRQAERTPTGPKLVYICAPLQGDVKKNVEFARRKAQEVFQGGDIPICPHLMFPPIADPGHPAEDQTAREMGLRLVESCHQINVYGPEWTDGMWAEINHASKLGIPLMTDQKNIGRTHPRVSPKTR